MFRRTTKGSFENVTTLYEEDPSLRKNYSPHYQQESRIDAAGLYEAPKSVETPSHPSVSPMTQEENPKWSDQEENSVSLSFVEEPETTLGEGVSFKGELVFEKLLRIDGTFEGKLVSSGKIIVGPTGRVKADINLGEAIIEGVVEGNVTTKGKVEARGEAIIIGDISASSLCVDEGVSITGYVCVSRPNTSCTEESIDEQTY
ncbi:bactofilin family protein [Chlamydiifrater phoenicopteri]|uniref:bactofilin family protein n=1 Tax=Chlamydiifrater phoenicopteri TaxID=2681469 RepID=UPI001BD07C23|nr:polymer-forming cytoskeletal protein [Chlamydiifrater phoenicopteri]